MSNIDALTVEINNMKQMLASGFDNVNNKIDRLEKKVDNHISNVVKNTTDIEVIKAVKGSKEKEIQANKYFGVAIGVVISLLGIVITLIIYITSHGA